MTENTKKRQPLYIFLEVLSGRGLRVSGIPGVVVRRGEVVFFRCSRLPVLLGQGRAVISVIDERDYERDKLRGFGDRPPCRWGDPPRSIQTEWKRAPRAGRVQGTCGTRHAWKTWPILWRYVRPSRRVALRKFSLHPVGRSG